MARVQNTLIGRASGSVGQVVFLTWKLINVTRAKPMSVYNPDTIPQKKQRNTFAQTVGLYNALKFVLNKSLKNRNRLMTLFNYFQSLNMATAFDNNGDGTVTLVPSKLIVSKGSMMPLKIDTISLSSYGGTSQITYSTESNFNQLPTDTIDVIAFNPDVNVFQVFEHVGVRSDGELFFNLGSAFGSFSFVHLYIMSHRENDTLYSDSEYRVQFVF